MSPLVSNEYDPNGQVLVMRQHLQEILAALSWAHTHFYALDLSEAARQGRAEARPSKATTLIQRAYNHTEGYLVDESTPSIILPE